MRLTWRDAAATGLVAAGTAVYVEFVRVGHILGIADAKAITAVVFLAGMAACVVGGGLAHIGTPGSVDRGVVVASVIGSLMLFAAVMAMLLGSAVLLALVVAGTVVLWVVATVRHLAVRPHVVAGRPASYPDRFLARPRR